MSLKNLPKDIVIIITKYLTIDNLINFKKTCRENNKIEIVDLGDSSLNQNLTDDNLKKITGLEKLSLWLNKSITNDTLTTLSRLKFLSMNNDFIITKLTRLDNLRYLTNIKMYDQLKKLTNLTKLDIIESTENFEDISFLSKY